MAGGNRHGRNLSLRSRRALTQVVYDDGNIIRYTYDDNSNILSVQVLGDPLFANGFEQ